MRDIENTTERVKTPAGALEVLLDQVATGRAIERMEERGQQQLVASAYLPAEGADAVVKAYGELGLVIGEPKDGDPLFVKVTLPRGWKKEASDHAMWSYVVDADGVKKIGVFYKAASYDRRASMNVEHPR